MDEPLGRDHELSRATAYRYVDEVITVLAEQAPDLHEAIQQAHEHDMAYVILDGTVITTDRLNEKTTSVLGWASCSEHASSRVGASSRPLRKIADPHQWPLRRP